MINPEATFRINREKFISSAFADEMMLMNLETGNYLGLNAVSTDIFQLAEEETSATQVIAFLRNKYEVDEETCRDQVMTCIETMMEKNMLIKI